MAQEHYSLQNFQADFTQAIVAADEEPRLLKEIIPAGKLADGSAALAVHRDGYYARLTEALGETFEGCWYLLGDEDFFTLCREYIDTHRSTCYSLSDYGEEMPSFIASHPNYQDTPYLKDLARLDLAFMETFHAAPHIPLSINAITQLGIEQLEKSKIVFGPAINLLVLDYSVLTLWQSRTLEQVTNSNLLSPVEQATHLMMYKIEQQTYIQPISKEQSSTLSLLILGQEVGAVVELAEDNSNDYDLAGVFQIIGTTGIVTKIETK
ncbi:MAG: DUF2063 domain-containing protein [Bdellovibrionales bacterium]|nr:DUF2063 domain-containing protein [Bdellovibrionales bacterium]